MKTESKATAQNPFVNALTIKIADVKENTNGWKLFLAARVCKLTPTLVTTILADLGHGKAPDANLVTQGLTHCFSSLPAPKGKGIERGIARLANLRAELFELVKASYEEKGADDEDMQLGMYAINLVPALEVDRVSHELLCCHLISKMLPEQITIAAPHILKPAKFTNISKGKISNRVWTAVKLAKAENIDRVALLKLLDLQEFLVKFLYNNEARISLQDTKTLLKWSQWNPSDNKMIVDTTDTILKEMNGFMESIRFGYIDVSWDESALFDNVDGVINAKKLRGEAESAVLSEIDAKAAYKTHVRNAVAGIPAEMLPALANGTNVVNGVLIPDISDEVFADVVTA